MPPIPQPVEVKVMKGTYRADRDGPRPVLFRPGGVPVMPADFKGEARALWEAVVPGLVEVGLVGAADAPCLVMMCEWWARYRKLGAACDKLTPSNDKYRVMLAGVARASGEFYRIAAKYGLTIADRSRVAPPGGGEDRVKGVPSRDRKSGPPPPDAG
jgi:phage terminase small subunit